MITVRPTIEHKKVQIGEYVDFFNRDSGIWALAQVIEKNTDSSMLVTTFFPFNNCAHPALRTFWSGRFVRLATASA